jgi:hypothetical protein
MELSKIVQGLTHAGLFVSASAFEILKKLTDG